MIFETTTKTQIGRHRFAFKVVSQDGTARPFAFSPQAISTDFCVLILLPFGSLSDVSFVDVLRASVLGLETNIRIVRCFLGFLRPPAKLRGIPKTQY